MSKLIDSHTHTNFNSFKDDYQQVIQRALDQEINLINVGSQYSTSARAIKIAQLYSNGVYAAIGLHPIHLFDIEVDEDEIEFASRQERFEANKYQDLIKQDKAKKIVAVGEIGLDYYHLPKNKFFDEVKKIQVEQLILQLKFAVKNNLPVIIHCRGSQQDAFGAYDDIYNILKQQIGLGLNLRGVIHCYGGNLSQAKKFIALGFYIGFTGIITFGRNAENLRNIVKELPLNKILIETDAPYLTPAPYRGERNEPSYVKFVAQKISEIKAINFNVVAQQTVKNTESLFKIQI